MFASFGAAGTYLTGGVRTTSSIPVPAGLVNGHVVLVHLYLEITNAVTPPTGFVEITTALTTTDFTAGRVFYKRVTNATADLAAGTYAFTHPSGYTEGVAERWSDVIATGSPIDVSNCAQRSTAATGTPAVTVTTTGRDRTLVWSATSVAQGAWTPPANYTERVDTGLEQTVASKYQGAAGSSGSVAGSGPSGTMTAWLLALRPATKSVPLTVIDTGAWASAATSGASLPVPYPAAAADGTASANDRLYMVLHSKPDTVAPAPSASWTLVEEGTGGAGAVAADTGPTRWSVYQRSIPGAGLTTTTSITTTGASVTQGMMVQLRPAVAGVTWDHDLVMASIATAATSLAATAGSALDLSAGDQLAILVGSPSDASTTQTVSTVTATGCTMGTLSNPQTTAVSGTGNDIASSTWMSEVTDGAAVVAPSITGTSAASTTRAIGFLRVRASIAETPADDSVTGAFAGSSPQASGALTATETTPGVLAGSAPQARGGLVATETTAAALAGSAPQARGGLTATETIPGVVAGRSPQAGGSLVAVVPTPGVFTGQAPQAGGTLAATQRIPGVLAGKAPVAVGGLVAPPPPPSFALPLRAGTPVVAPGWSTESVSTPDGWSAGSPTVAAGWRSGPVTTADDDGG